MGEVIKIYPPIPEHLRYAVVALENYLIANRELEACTAPSDSDEEVAAVGRAFVAREAAEDAVGNLEDVNQRHFAEMAARHRTLRAIQPKSEQQAIEG